MASVVLIEPYYGGSHRSWADSWLRHSRHDIVLLTHPDQFWRWRMRGGAVTLAEELQNHIELSGRPDLVVVSGLVNVAELVGLARASLGSTPVALYVHESQLLYPLAPGQRADTSAALVNWSSLLAADTVWFNSDFHRSALRNALPALLEAQPDPGHAHLITQAFANSRVLWPGVETAKLSGLNRTERLVPRVLWNQRWDHDKNPHEVFTALAQLADEGIDFTLSLAGQNQRPQSKEFVSVADRLGDRIDHVGFVPDGDYEQHLAASDVVVSAADHEFFGIALVEAMAAGAVPVFPHRLSFPELVEPQWHDAALYPEGGLSDRLRSVLSDLAAARGRLDGLRESMMKFDARQAATDHDQAVDDVIDLPSRSW